MPDGSTWKTNPLGVIHSTVLRSRRRTCPAAVGLHPVREATQGCEVGWIGLPRWPDGVVGLDVVQIHRFVGFAGAVGEHLDGVHQLDAFTDPVGDLVGIDTDRVMQVDHGLHGVRAVPDQLAQLRRDQRADVLDAQDADAGGEGVIGQVNIDLGLPRPQPPARSRGARADAATRAETDDAAAGADAEALALVWAACLICASRASSTRRASVARGSPSSVSSRRPGSNGSTTSPNGASSGSGRSLSLGCGASRSASSSRPGSAQSFSRSSPAG